MSNETHILGLPTMAANNIDTEHAAGAQLHELHLYSVKNELIING